MPFLASCCTSASIKLCRIPAPAPCPKIKSQRAFSGRMRIALTSPELWVASKRRLMVFIWLMIFVCSSAFRLVVFKLNLELRTTSQSIQLVYLFPDAFQTKSEFAPRHPLKIWARVDRVASWDKQSFPSAHQGGKVQRKIPGLA